jgi:hypothetical protein
MNDQLVRVGQHVFNLAAIVNVKWKGSTLYMDFVGGRFQAFEGHEAQVVWHGLVTASLDLETGEVGSVGQ